MSFVCSLYSGSSGNSTYIGNCDGGFLVDIGRSLKYTKNALNKIHVDIDRVKGLFITHEHSDHVAGLEMFIKCHNVPVFSTEGTAKELLKTNRISSISDITVIDEKIELYDCVIKKIPTSHDAADSCGFSFEFKRGQTACVVTDLGLVNEEIINAVGGCDCVVIESNYDNNMLLCGNYPYVLKKRISGVNGHLSNDDCAMLLKRLVTTGTNKFLLAHLSKENNMPEIAYSYSKNALDSLKLICDNDYILEVAPRDDISKKIYI